MNEAELIFAQGTDVGRVRDHNEDATGIFDPKEPRQRQAKGYLFIVADGMGGHQAGEVASAAAVKIISGAYYQDPDLDVRAALTRAIEQANASIHQDAQRTASRAGMGTTVVAAVIRGRELYLANVGDSRAYLMRGGQVGQITHDHSFVEEQVRAGILSEEEARVHPQRNVVTRALGSRPEVLVETYSYDWQPGDALLLCSDGLSEYVHADDMRETLSRYPPEESVRRLIGMANERGGGDNISVVVVHAPPFPFATPIPGAAAPTAPAPAPARAGGALSLPLLLGGGAALLLILAIVAVAGFAILSGAAKKTVTPTPPPTPGTPPAEATVTPTPLPSSTLIPQAGETATPEPGAPTATPRVGFNLSRPAEGESIPPGGVLFEWKFIGDRSEDSVFVVNSTRGELCRSEKEQFCSMTLAAGQYEWWVELWSGAEKRAESDHRVLRVAQPATATPTPAPATPTSSPPPAATQKPSGGGQQPQPTQTPLPTVAVPTVEMPTIAPPATEPPATEPPQPTATAVPENQ